MGSQSTASASGSCRSSTRSASASGPRRRRRSTRRAPRLASLTRSTGSRSRRTRPGSSARSTIRLVRFGRMALPPVSPQQLTETFARGSPPLFAWSEGQQLLHDRRQGDPGHSRGGQAHRREQEGQLGDHGGLGIGPDDRYRDFDEPRKGRAVAECGHVRRGRQGPREAARVDRGAAQVERLSHKASGFPFRSFQRSGFSAKTYIPFHPQHPPILLQRLSPTRSTGRKTAVRLLRPQVASSAAVQSALVEPFREAVNVTAVARRLRAAAPARRAIASSTCGGYALHEFPDRRLQREAIY